jgi:hypothetical protein
MYLCAQNFFRNDKGLSGNYEYAAGDYAESDDDDE